MKKITLTRNGQTSPRDTEVSTMHADGLVVGQSVMLRIKGDCCPGMKPTPYKEYVVTKIVKSDRFDKKCSDITFVRAGKDATGETPVVPVKPATGETPVVPVAKRKRQKFDPWEDGKVVIKNGKVVLPVEPATGETPVVPVEPVALTDDQVASAISKQYQVVIRAEAATFRERVRLGAMLLQWERFLGEARGGKGGGAGGGLKGWLEKNCPELGYDSALSYKTMAERAIKMLGGGAVVTAALMGEYAVEDPSGEVVAVDCTVRRKADEFFEKADSRRKLEQMWFEFMNGEGQPRKTRGKGLDVGGEAVPVLTAAQTAHAEWSRLFMLKGRFAKMVRLAASLTRSDASDAIELLRPLMDALRARVKEG